MTGASCLQTLFANWSSVIGDVMSHAGIFPLLVMFLVFMERFIPRDSLAARPRDVRDG